MQTRRDIHVPHDYFEYVRFDDGPPPARPDRIDVAVLDMNHNWPNVGHDSIVHAILEASESLREELLALGAKVRAISFDVRRKLQIAPGPNGQFHLYVGTGGPGHLDPRQNDGQKSWSQGIAEDPSWELPLFKLFEEIERHESAALIGICHSFGLMCRWSGIAEPRLRSEKSSGMPMNTLSDEALRHPWFGKFAKELADQKSFRVVDNRLFDLVCADRDCIPLAWETGDSDTMTMAELRRSPDDQMPRIYGVNHHPEIIDRQHVQQVLEEKRAHGEVTEQWYRERADTLSNEFQGESERQSRVTSRYTFLEPLRYHIAQMIAAR